MNTMSAPLRPVTGPLVVGDNPRRFAQLVWLLSATEFKLRYRGSVLGYAWTLIAPLLIFGVLYLVFTRVIRFGGEIKAYPVVLLMNVMLFRFFAETTSSSVHSMVTRESLVRKTQFPRLAVPLAVVTAAALGLGLNLLVVFGYVLVYGIEPTATWLLFPLVLIGLLVFTAATATLLSALYARYRDVAQIWTVCTLTLLYLTPVLYPAQLAPDGMREVISVNPLALLLTLARKWVIDPAAPGPAEDVGALWGIVAPLLVLVAVCSTAYVVFKREAGRIAEDL